jgi:hypothetical protein
LNAVSIADGPPKIPVDVSPGNFVPHLISLSLSGSRSQAPAPGDLIGTLKAQRSTKKEKTRRGLSAEMGKKTTAATIIRLTPGAQIVIEGSTSAPKARKTAKKKSKDAAGAAAVPKPKKAAGKKKADSGSGMTTTKIIPLPKKEKKKAPKASAQ